MMKKRDFPTSKELEFYALAVVNFVCCHSYTQTTTDECEYIQNRSPTIPPKWMGESPLAEKVFMTNFTRSQGYKTGKTEDSALQGAHRRQKRFSAKLDTKGFPPRPMILDSPESKHTCASADWNSAGWKAETVRYHSCHSASTSIASSSSSDSDSIFGHPVYSLQTCKYEE